MPGHEEKAAMQGIRNVLVPFDVASDALAFLRYAGRLGCEGLVLWVGTRVEDAFHVRRLYVPEQHCVRGEEGLLVHVDSNALHTMNVWLFENRYTVIAQLHTHPTDAYHSDTDNDFPIATRLGSFSIVVPDFADGEFDLLSYAVYRLGPQGWTRLPQREVEETFLVGDAHGPRRLL